MLKESMSHFFGVVIAVTVVATLIFLLYLSSESFAAGLRQDRMDAKSLTELSETIENPRATDKVEAILAVGKGDDQLPERIRLLGQMAMSVHVDEVAAATVGLRRMGDSAIPVIREMLETEETEEIRWACAAARTLGTGADVLAPDLKKLMESGDTNARNSALFAFQTMSPEVALTVLQKAIDSLDDSNFNVQCSACRVIERIGPNAFPAVERLIQLGEEGNVSTKGWSSIALGSIGPVEGYDIAKILEGRLNEFSFIEKERALQGLANMGRDGESAKAEVEAMMTDNSRRCMPQAAATYALITGKSDESLKVLKELLKSESYRDTAIECLGWMGTMAAPLTSDLAKMLTHSEPATRENAALALGRIGPQAKSALSELKKLANDKDMMVCEAAKEAIAKINPPDNEKSK
jgi:HEAT repeat protein